jgi:potassium/hydrogen antiporter
VPFRRTIVAFHQGLAFLAQVVLFIVLGLLVFPSGLDDVAASAIALTIALVVVARPLAVVVSTAFQRFALRDRLFVGWAGLRGAVPIVLATFVQSENVAESDTIFNAVFFVVLVSALVQGPTLEPLARRLRLATAARPLHRPPIDVGAPELDLLDFHVREGDGVARRAVRDLHLPREALLAVVVRDGDSVPPRGSTVVEPDDVLWVITRPEVRERVEDLFESWRSRAT